MKKITLKRTDLLHQIDMQTQGRDLPDILILEGIETDQKLFDTKFDIDFPNARRSLSRTQFEFMSLMYEEEGKCVLRHRFFPLLRQSNGVRSIAGMGMQNTIAVHVKELRAKLGKGLLPFWIETHRGVGYSLRKKTV